MKIELLDTKDLPGWFAYPEDFLLATNDGLWDIGPWQILGGEWLKVRANGLKENFPNRELIPFARRLDNDDIACWENSSFPAVQVIHDFAAPGWEDRESFESFQAWLFAAHTDSSEFDD